MLVRLANMEGSDLGLTYLSRPFFGGKLVFKILGSQIVNGIEHLNRFKVRLHIQ